MSLRSAVTVAVGRAARFAARLKGGGRGGSALPGLVAEKIDPGFMARTLHQLPRGVVLVSGTNGKTTTTKMVADLLTCQGLRVFTNPTGSNFTRGVVAALLTAVSRTGRLDADIAVLELDEAHAVHFVRAVKPRAALLLNVMRDQLDRFGEIDHTAQLLRQVAEATSDVVVVSADDPRLSSAQFLAGLRARVVSFGVGPQLRQLFVSDDELRAGGTIHQTTTTGAAPAPRGRLMALAGDQVTVEFDGQEHTAQLPIPGVHNRLNATAALVLVAEVLGAEAHLDALLTAAGGFKAAFGRGEVIEAGGLAVEFALVKNPAGFRMSLLSTGAADPLVMIAINDEYADGRDVSWLWDVDFETLRPGGVELVTGTRCYDMALRLAYDDVAVASVQPDVLAALDELLRRGQAARRPMRIFTTYTAMLALRAELISRYQGEEVF